MPVTENILRYAARTGRSFRKKDLLAALRPDASVNEASLSALLGRLVAMGRLVKTGWGKYALAEGVKPRFPVRPREEALQVSKSLQERYPLVNFCIWDAFCVIPFMLHVPNVNITVVDVERDAMETFFDAVRELYPQHVVLPHPSREEYYTYGAGKDSIVIHPLYTESPLEPVGSLRFPTAEKLLVDIAVNPEFDYLQGSEIYTIYGNVLRRYTFSRSGALRYARRCACADTIQKIFNSLDLPDHDSPR